MLKDSIISNNKAQGTGGGVMNDRGALTLDDSAVENNVADEGGVYNQATLNVTNHTLIIGNQATEDARNAVAAHGGGGLNNSGSTGDTVAATISDSYIVGNTAPLTSGSGVFNNIKLIVTNSMIANNSSSLGGGLYDINDDAQAQIHNSCLMGNQVENEALAGSGSGIQNDAEPAVDIPHGGGGINNATENSQVTISDSFVIGNHGDKTTGGGIFNSATLTVTHSVLADNISGAGGALYNDFGGQGSISGSCIMQNKVLLVTPAGLGSGIESAMNLFDASKNWWGAASGPGPFGPGSGDSVTRNMTFNDFLKTPPDIYSGAVPTPYPTPPAP